MPLRLNDENKFYGPIAINGDPSQLRRATVVGVLPYDLEYPLLLSNKTIPLPAIHRVRRLPDVRGATEYGRYWVGV